MMKEKGGILSVGDLEEVDASWWPWIESGARVGGGVQCGCGSLNNNDGPDDLSRSTEYAPTVGVHKQFTILIRTCQSCASFTYLSGHRHFCESS